MTTNTIEHAVRRVIHYMHVNLSQDLTIDDMARTAMFSKFHFTRFFREVTGTSPGRFLSALRIQEAKRLLIHTEFSVADIGSQVGYSSIGTFSSRFKACVGLSPSAYRELGGVLTKMPQPAAQSSAVAQRLTLRGRVVAEQPAAEGPVFVGLFPSRVPQGRPVRWAALGRPGPFELRDVPNGTWHLLVHSLQYGHEGSADGPADPGVLAVGRYGPITVHPGALLLPAEVVLRPVDVLDPPVLLARPAAHLVEKGPREERVAY
ncbi:AraC family transcriptional regulator (plasmid) [Streptomyces sp. RerS4]|nr:AraC family transcriptional regulator [Streptomyces sp. RerS4]UQX05484.1 AraC family transcriptional regulator [Streptomyces sp. RerS4]